MTGDARQPTRRYDYIADGPAIYADSFATIRREADLSRVPADAEKLAVRMIHGSRSAGPDRRPGDPSRAGPRRAFRAALRRAHPVRCTYGRHGYHRGPTPRRQRCALFPARPGCAGARPTVEHHPHRGRRLVVGAHPDGAVVAVGNAPTALFHLLEMLLDGAPRPAAIIGCPVGFVGAAESKDALIALSATRHRHPVRHRAWTARGIGDDLVGDQRARVGGRMTAAPAAGRFYGSASARGIPS